MREKASLTLDEMEAFTLLMNQSSPMLVCASELSVSLRGKAGRDILRPGKSGGTWEPSSKKLFGLQENIQSKSRTFVENQVLCRKSRTIRIKVLAKTCLE